VTLVAGGFLLQGAIKMEARIREIPGSSAFAKDISFSKFASRTKRS
jgi:hypothetical protein